VPWPKSHKNFPALPKMASQNLTKKASRTSSHPPPNKWHLSSPLKTTHFITILNFLIKMSNHQKIQEDLPSEWDVGHFFVLGTASQKKDNSLKPITYRIHHGSHHHPI
jgi:hypothetical protein